MKNDNVEILARLRGVPARQSTPEDEADPRNPNNRNGQLVTGWQPIASAPRDRFVLLYVPNGQLETGPVTLGHWWPPIEPHDERGRFKKGAFVPAHWNGWLGSDADHSPSWCDPTHWMPLPDPPVQ